MNLKVSRVKAGLSQKQAQELTGIDQATISRLECGKVCAEKMTKYLAELAKAYGCTVADLINEPSGNKNGGTTHGNENSEQPTGV